MMLPLVQRFRRKPHAESANPEDLDSMVDGIVSEANSSADVMGQVA